MNEQFLKDTLFPIIRSGMGISTESAPASIDYKLLIEIASKQGILPIIREGLTAMQLEGDDVCAVRNKCLKDFYLFAQRDYALETIKSCFEKHDIEYVILKGSVLRDLYPKKWMRTSCDIDVLIHESDLDNAVSTLQKETDFKFSRRLYHDVSLMTTNVHLELHFSIKENMNNIDQLLSKAWEYTVKQKGSHQYCFSPEYQVFHVVAHMSYHFVHGGLGIRSYIDLWLLRHKTEFDGTIVKQMCKQCGILKFYEECCNLSEVWLSNKEHTSITKAIEKYSVEGGVFGSKKNLMLSKRRNHRGLSFYFSRLFVSNDALKEMYPNAKKYPILLPYYQLRRWPKAIFSKRKDVFREIKSARNTSENDIESFDQLLKSVGM